MQNMLRHVNGGVAVAFAVLALVAVFFLVNSGSLQSPQASPHNGAQTQSSPTPGPNSAIPPSSSSVETKHEQGGGMRLDPPPSNSQPAHAWQEAFAKCSRDPNATCGSGTTEIMLANFSDDLGGQCLSADCKSGKPLYQDVLVWVMTWHNQGCPVSGPGSTSDKASTPASIRPICDVVEFVNANTLEVLPAFIGGGIS